MQAGEATPRRKRGRASEIDRQVAVAIRECRLRLGISQRELAERVGVTCRQMYKYEIGLTRLSVSRLLAIAQALGVPPRSFFPGHEVQHSPQTVERENRLLKLTRNFAAIADPRQQEAIYALVRALADSKAELPED